MTAALRLETDTPPSNNPPWVCAWDETTRPLPRRLIRLPRHGRSRRNFFGLQAPPYWSSGPLDAPFDFCGHIRRLCADIVARIPELSHIDVNRLLVAVTQARNARKHGLQARVTPLRFRDGQLIRQRRGVPYQVQRFIVDRREILYLITFCLPRFLDQDFDDKLITLFHELYHISPAFNGDLRRHPGRCHMHSRSKRAYDEQMAQLARAYLAERPDPQLYSFLRLNFAQLDYRHGGVVGIVVPRPKLVPI